MLDQDALTHAGATDDEEALALLDLQRHPLQDDFGTEGLVNVLEDDGHAMSRRGAQAGRTT